ncbi:mobilization protein [Rhizobium rhizophilum]|uniref:Mobilization protein n=1 Tax=Rhizobium rhizophilum TaxID=1850373 RepID=A0ABY2QP47_9HYPH|nr:mobilization protein [Rhizobium rhizophilum]THV10561.1 mobilization protein [Rhizobium rhizophilum]
MTKRSIQERLRQLEARKQVLVARLGKEERARDTRRKILIGALVLDRIERQPEGYLSGPLDEWLRAELPGFLTREKDLDLFDDILGPAKPDEATDGEQQS